MPQLINALNNLISPELLGKAAVHLNEDPKSVNNAGKGIISGLVATVVEKSDDSALEKVLGLAGEAYPTITESMDDIFSGNISNVVKEVGATFLGSVLGNNLGAFSDMITNDYKIASGSSNSLIGMIAPVVASSLGVNMKQDGTDLEGLANELMEEKDSFVPNVPNGMAGILGLSSLTLIGNKIISGGSNLATGAVKGVTGAVENVADGAANVVGGVADGAAKAVDGVGDALTGAAGKLGKGAGNVVGKVTGAASDVAHGAANVVDKVADGVADGVGTVAEGTEKLATGAVKKTSSLMSWLLPLILVLAAVLLLIYLLNTCSGRNTDAIGGADQDDANSQATEQVDESATTGEREETQLTLPSGETINAYKGGIEDQLLTFLKSGDYKNMTDEQLKEKWFNFDNINFEFGSTNQLTPESKVQSDNVTAILKEFPDAYVKIGAYTDRVGDDLNNKKISQERAEYIMSLLSSDPALQGHVLGAEGYGEEFAKVPEDASDEERASDRHVSLRLAKENAEPTEAATE